MYKDHISTFSILAEEQISRFNQGGFQSGDYCVIRKNAINHPEIKNKASQFIDKVKQMINSDKPLKISAIKSSRPESSNDLASGAGNAFSGEYLDIITCLTPATWVDPITLPADVVDVVTPENNNWSPSHPESWKYKNKVQIKPKNVEKAEGETEEQTKGSKQKLPTSDTKGISKGTAKSPKIKKAIEYKKESSGDGVEDIGAIYENLALLQNRKYILLKNEATDACHNRGHILGDWKDFISENNIIGHNECLHCNKGVQVMTHPMPNEIEIGGEAVALDCDAQTTEVEPGEPTEKLGI